MKMSMHCKIVPVHREIKLLGCSTSFVDPLCSLFFIQAKGISNKKEGSCCFCVSHYR